jgi:hypothetical protein
MVDPNSPIGPYPDDPVGVLYTRAFKIVVHETSGYADIVISVSERTEGRKRAPLGNLFIENGKPQIVWGRKDVSISDAPEYFDGLLKACREVSETLRAIAVKHGPPSSIEREHALTACNRADRVLRTTKLFDVPKE